MGLDINLNTSKIDISEEDGLNVDLYSDNIDIGDDNADDIIIEITGLKSINKFIGLEDTPLYYDNGKFFKVEDNKIVYTDIQWKDISGDLEDAPEIIDLIKELVEKINEEVIHDYIDKHNNSQLAHPYIRNIIEQNYGALDTKINDTKEELSESIQQETLARIEADTTLQNNIDTLTNNLNTEIENRTNADVTLQSNIDSLSTTVSQNYQELNQTITNTTNTINNRINTEVEALNTALTNENTQRQEADSELQSQIDAIVSSSDVFDIVGTYAELQAYDITTVPVNDIIKVLVDSTHNDSATYYRCIENEGVKSWLYIGSEGAYYTKSESDTRFVNKNTTINNKPLSSNITLTANDVGALPDTTIIGNGTLTIQVNGSDVTTFTANQTGNTTANIITPTVDQTFDGTSANAQSGVAIAGELNNYVKSSAEDSEQGITSSIGYLEGYAPMMLMVRGDEQFIVTTGEGASLYAYNTNTGNQVLLGVAPNGVTILHNNQQALLTLSSNNNLTVNGTEVQPLLVSGTNIKTINNESILGSGNIEIQMPTVDQTFDGTSANAQSGVAIAGELNSYVKAEVGNYHIMNTGNDIQIGYANDNDNPTKAGVIGINEQQGIVIGALDGETDPANPKIFITTTTPNGLVLTNGISQQNTILNVSNNNLTVNGTEVQPQLVSGTNIKTINGESVLGSGNITISADFEAYTATEVETLWESI